MKLRSFVLAGALALLASSAIAQTYNDVQNLPTNMRIQQVRYTSGTISTSTPRVLNIAGSRLGGVAYISASTLASVSVITTDASGNNLTTLGTVAVAAGGTVTSVSIPTPSYAYGIKISPTAFTSVTVINGEVLTYPVWGF